MKITLLNGSPKRGNSDTMHITRAFVDGMDEVQQNQVRIINTAEKNVGYCRGCLSCMQSGECVQKDDMQAILESILECDLLLLSFPLYCYSMPSTLKAVVDRMLPLSKMAMQKQGDRYVHTCAHDVSNKRYCMISGCGFPNAEHNFEAVTTQFNLLFPPEASTIITITEAPMFGVASAAPLTAPLLKLVSQAGREYAASGHISEETAARIRVPMLPKEIYAAICSGNGAEPK